MLTKDPTSVFSRYTAMPIQIFQWATNPKQEFQDLAASGIIVLLVFLLSANALAIMLRNKYQKERG
jgi:phosphate transport system permease protein